MRKPEARAGSRLEEFDLSTPSAPRQDAPSRFGAQLCVSEPAGPAQTPLEAFGIHATQLPRVTATYIQEFRSNIAEVFFAGNIPARVIELHQLEKLVDHLHPNMSRHIPSRQTL